MYSTELIDRLMKILYPLPSNKDPIRKLSQILSDKDVSVIYENGKFTYKIKIEKK